MAADSIDGRFAQDDRAHPRAALRVRKRDRRNGKEAQILLRSWGHAPPGMRCCSAQFGTNQEVVLSPENENGIASMVSIYGTGLDERINQVGDQTALLEQIVANPAELGRIWRGQTQIRPGQGRVGCQVVECPVTHRRIVLVLPERGKARQVMVVGVSREVFGSVNRLVMASSNQ